MRRIFVSIVVFLLFLSTGGAAEKGAEQPPVAISVDPRVELVSIIFRLAGNYEYNQGRVPSYIKDVEEHFGPFRQHRAVQLAQELRRKRGVSFDACMGLAVHLTDAYELKEKVPLSPRPESLDSRWEPDEAREFLNALRQFVQKSSFKTFVEKHRELYDLTESRMKILLEKEGHNNWFDHFFGMRAGARFNVALGLVNGGCCYGPHCRNQDGKDELFCILGVWQTDKEGMPLFTRDMVRTVVHEFCHSYANPIIDRHKKELQTAGEKIFPRVAPAMRRQAYDNWVTMFYESLVRASTLRYIRKFDGEWAGWWAAQNEKSRGFAWMEELYALLGEYEAQRDRYPTMETFAPRLVSFFNDYADKKPARKVKGPKVISTSPANGQKDVDPALTKIEVVFDCPMRANSWSLVGGGPNFPEITGKPGYDAKRTTWTVPVQLKPEWQYQFMLNSDRFQAFQNEEGIPLEPVRIGFTTGKGKVAEKKLPDNR